MLKYVLKKLAFTVLVLVGAATCAFILVRAIPGDTAEALAGPQASSEDVENLRHAMNLDAPYIEQYAKWSPAASGGGNYCFGYVRGARLRTYENLGTY